MKDLRRRLQMQLHEDAAQPSRGVDGVGEDERPSGIALQEVVDGGVLNARMVENWTGTKFRMALESDPRKIG